MTHAKTLRREEKRGLNEEKFFAPLRLCVRQKNLPPHSWRGTLHTFLA